MTREHDGLTDLFGEPIHVHTRAQLIADGDLIDVSETAKEAGFKFPVAVSAAVWGEYIEPSKTDSKRWGQDVQGRLWDTLWMLFVAIKSSKGNGGQRTDYEVRFRIKGQLRRIQLYAIIGPGDHGEGVITIMKPGED